MASRLELQTVLETILGSKNVYYQSPSFLAYPCIVYARNTYDVWHADDKKYHKRMNYTVTLISKTADNEELINKILELDYCRYDRRFINDNLYHDTFNLYF